MSNPRLEIKGLNDSDTLVLNVTGTSVTGTSITLKNDNHPNHFANILWNFAYATMVNVNGNAFEGSLLAPKAAIDQNQLVEGNIIAKSLIGHGYEEHFLTNDAKFTGLLPSGGPAATPEPNSVALLVGMSVTGAGFLARRRSTRKDFQLPRALQLV